MAMKFYFHPFCLLPVVQGSAGKMKPGSSSESGLMSTDSFLEEAIKRQENNQDEESSTGSISLSEDDLSVLYEGLSYASNIRRSVAFCSLECCSTTGVLQSLQ